VTTTPTVDRLDEGSVRFAAKLHATTLPSGFFARLGPRWLRAYYRTFIDSPYAVALVARLDGQRAGVLVGATDSARHYAWVIRTRGPSLAVLAALAMVGRPRVAALFVRTRARRYARRLLRRPTTPVVTTQPAEPVAVLTHLAILAEARRNGVGAALVQRFTEELRQAGRQKVILVTLAGDAGAGPFYKRLGWTHVTDRRNHDGQEVSMFSLDLTTP
jgi:ribosomal protein S18 acetylase RimI-like enzyme